MNFPRFHDIRTFRKPWFEAFASARLNIQPVRDRLDLARAYDLASRPEVGGGMEFPKNLTWPRFEEGYHQQPRKDLFLLAERGRGRRVGLVILWPVPGRRGWHQILYGLLPEHRGHGYAQEGCRALLARMAATGVSEGVLAIVAATNVGSEAVVRGLGMVRADAGSRGTWVLPLVVPEPRPLALPKPWPSFLLSTGG